MAKLSRRGLGRRGRWGSWVVAVDRSHSSKPVGWEVIAERGAVEGTWGWQADPNRCAYRSPVVT
eukprot:6273300-Alexandrium_andersonii.AAC.1